MNVIHPTAIVDSRARLGMGIEIGPYAIVEAGVEIGDGCRLGPHSVLRTGARLGANCTVDAHAVIAGLPQDLRFDVQTPSFVDLADGVTVREGVTIHRATRAEQSTVIGEKAFLMAYSHVGHDCFVGVNVIIANNVMLAGNVRVGAWAFLGGGAALHQFVRVGESVMLSGLSRITRDLPPFTMVAERDELIGLNLVGLKRRQMSRTSILDLKLCYRAVFSSASLSPKEAAAHALAQGLGQSAEGARFLSFFTDGMTQRGFVVPRERKGEANA
ncbi:MAG: acyl-ACP--UDP-N-acetylglucosamine O-acyltransferase [Verrucomicrobia bacterium]|nr:acyl-ACP--UDP-N-acetylglucosamine O-acyltransferase [Verrucomicrobiota bacterium]